MALRKATLLLLPIMVGILITVAPVSAHHSFSAEYDVDKPITLKGTLTKLDWVNPHSWIYVDVVGDDGKVVNWTCELVAPSNMINFGFAADSFKPGDQVTAIVTQVAKSGAPVARLGYNPPGLLRGWQDPK